MNPLKALFPIDFTEFGIDQVIEFCGIIKD